MSVRKVVLGSGVVLVALLVGVLGAGPLLYPREWPPTAAAARIAAAPDLDRALADAERAVGGVKPALAKGVLWRDTLTHQRTPLSIVYLHGFSASRRELSPVVEQLADSLGANVFFTRLTAHGRVDGEAFATVRALDWIDDAREALAIGRRIGDRVVVIATSTGATLALEMAVEDSSHIAAMVLVSPNHEPQDRRARFVSGPLGPTLARLIGGSHYGFTPTNAAHGEFWTARYRSEAIPAMMDLVNHERSLDLSVVRMPVLTLYTKRDKVVRVDLIESRHAELGSPRKAIVEVLEATRHEMASDALAPEVVAPVVADVLRYLREVGVVAGR
ncbi:MAG: alpha/beta fold hydrolase [Gemmatimonadaceae bacterium]|jgi:pimeloyl-ACP methyl ester carboxylesterase|nr:alpha/beta fold hydrolase [Gemmatimonadaceae bacterium]